MRSTVLWTRARGRKGGASRVHPVKLDSTDSSTKFYAVINDEPVDFGDMNPTGDGEPQSGTTDSGIQWTRVTPEESLSVNAGPTDDKKHTITLSVPSDLIEDDSHTSSSTL
ncbi:expressed unknown protein [Seminavis robusta]|uniref:Uncharacterized protein n=1 Tax=Seminavis robusta TaxID=568900 RepID=A0A9N8DJF3_9STRA|nr:expressed unknown protein [Seminavis robusta]|eukprot:Sro115_g056580.1 n/a (111) ;mRNA; f:341-673